MTLDGKSSQKYSVNAGVPQCSILGPTLFLLSLMTFLMMSSVTLLSMLIILLDWPNNTGAIYVKMDGSVAEEK